MTVWKHGRCHETGPGILHIGFTPIIITTTKLHISAFLRIGWRILRLTRCPWSLEGMLNYGGVGGGGRGVWARQLGVSRLLPQTFTPLGVVRRASLFTRSEARARARPFLASDVDSSASARTLDFPQPGPGLILWLTGGAALLPANPGMQTPLELTCGSNTSEVMEQSSFLSDVGSVPGQFYISSWSLLDVILQSCLISSSNSCNFTLYCLVVGGKKTIRSCCTIMKAKKEKLHFHQIKLWP